MAATSVWYGVNQYGSVVVTDDDIHAHQAFLDAVYSCRTVADAKALAERYPDDMDGVLEVIDEHELTDDESWNEEMMPGFGDGYWPPRYENGMADLFTEEQVDYLIKHCDARISDSMGGICELFFIPEEQVERVGELLHEWGFRATRADDTLLG